MYRVALLAAGEKKKLSSGCDVGEIEYQSRAFLSVSVLQGFPVHIEQQWTHSVFYEKGRREKEFLLHVFPYLH